MSTNQIKQKLIEQNSVSYIERNKTKVKSSGMIHLNR